MNYRFLRVNQASDEIIDSIRQDENLERYTDWVMNKLKCETLDDLVLLESLSEKDVEGWNVSSFFPADLKIEEKVIHDDMDENSESEIKDLFKNFSIGLVTEITVNGTKFISDRNASPIGIYANKNDIW